MKINKKDKAVPETKMLRPNNKKDRAVPKKKILKANNKNNKVIQCPYSQESDVEPIQLTAKKSKSNNKKNKRVAYCPSSTPESDDELIEAKQKKSKSNDKKRAVDHSDSDEPAPKNIRNTEASNKKKKLEPEMVTKIEICFRVKENHKFSFLNDTFECVDVSRFFEIKDQKYTVDDLKMKTQVTLVYSTEFEDAIVTAEISNDRIFQVPARKNKNHTSNESFIQHNQLLIQQQLLNQNKLKMVQNNSKILQESSINEIEPEISQINYSQANHVVADEEIPQNVLQTAININTKNDFMNEFWRGWTFFNNINPDQTWKFYEKNYPIEMKKLKEKLVKLVPEGDTFEKRMYKAVRCAITSKSKKNSTIKQRSNSEPIYVNISPSPISPISPPSPPSILSPSFIQISPNKHHNQIHYSNSINSTASIPHSIIPVSNLLNLRPLNNLTNQIITPSLKIISPKPNKFLV